MLPPATRHGSRTGGGTAERRDDAGCRSSCRCELKALRLVGAGAVDAVADLLIDTARLVLGVQRVPMAGFVGVQFRARRNDLGTLSGLPSKPLILLAR